MPVTLHDLIVAVPELSAPSTTKFRDLNAWLAEKAGLSAADVYAAYVNDASNLSVRLTQSKNALDRPLSIAVSAYPSGSADHRDIVAAAARLLGKEPRLYTIAICSKAERGSWELSEIVTINGVDGLIARLRQLSPAAEVQIVQRDIVAPSLRTPAVVALGGHAPPAPADLQALAAELYVDEEWLRQVLWLLDDKKALIFYGPPGTGKTFLARRIAAYLQDNPAWRRLVQLHPSYGYEDFFEGYRPTKAEHGLALEKTAGPLRYLAGEAARNPDQRVVLLMDEVNRGNLPRVFGELYFLLEYRSESASLMYSPELEFSLPPNLYFLGTMNTADRSVAVLDQALRRRFHFVPLFPGEPPVDQMLRAYLVAHRPQMAWVANLLDLANTKLDRHARVGPSHFMRRDLDDAVLARIWEFSVLPTIEEHYFGRDDDLAQLRLSYLKSQLNG